MGRPPRRSCRAHHRQSGAAAPVSPSRCDESARSTCTRSAFDPIRYDPRWNLCPSTSGACTISTALQSFNARIFARSSLAQRLQTRRTPRDECPLDPGKKHDPSPPSRWGPKLSDRAPPRSLKPPSPAALSVSGPIVSHEQGCSDKIVVEATAVRAVPAELVCSEGARREVDSGSDESLSASSLTSGLTVEFSHGRRVEPRSPRMRTRWTLVDATAKSGETYVVARPQRTRSPGLDGLTEREQQVVVQAAAGLSTKEIGFELRIAHSTVRVLLGRACARLGVSRGRLHDLPALRQKTGDPEP